MSSPDMSGFDQLFADFGFDPSASMANTTTVTATQQPKAEKPNKVAASVDSAVDDKVLTEAQAKMQRIDAELKNLYVERDELIKLMLLAVCTSTNLFMCGPPGSAKSALTQELCSRIEQGNYFQWMLNKTSDPSEILGSFSIKEMENDHFKRVTTGKLPEAHLVFLDEIMKCNSPTLNTLLTIMNEHTFYNDGVANPVPLISMFGASNEGPEDETLDALYDRFIFRIRVDYVHDAVNKKRMFSNYIDSRRNLLGLAGKTTITIPEIKVLQDATKTVKVSKDIVNKFIRLIAELDRQAIHVSDRRQNESIKVMQGSAILSGRKEVCLDDFRPLIYVLWQKEDQLPIIESTILKLINPYDDRFKDIMKSFSQLKQDIDSVTDPQEQTKKAIESKASIEKLVSKTNRLINEASKNGRSVEEFTTLRDNMIRYNQELIAKALGTSFPEFDTELNKLEY